MLHVGLHVESRTFQAKKVSSDIVLLVLDPHAFTYFPCCFWSSGSPLQVPEESTPWMALVAELGGARPTKTRSGAEGQGECPNTVNIEERVQGIPCEIPPDTDFFACRVVQLAGVTPYKYLSRDRWRGSRSSRLGFTMLPFPPPALRIPQAIYRVIHPHIDPALQSPFGAVAPSHSTSCGPWQQTLELFSALSRPFRPGRCGVGKRCRQSNNI